MIVTGGLPMAIDGKQCVTLIDELISLEMLYCNGYPLASSVYTCLYVHPVALQVLTYACGSSEDVPVAGERYTSYISPKHLETPGYTPHIHP